MSNLFKKYFENEDFNDAMAGILYDIRKNKIPAEDVVQLSDELLKKGLIQEKSGFRKEDRKSWNRKYLEYLMNGMSTGKVSKEYLIFYSNVSSTVRKKDKILKIIVFAVVIAALLISAAAALKLGGNYGSK